MERRKLGLSFKLQAVNVIQETWDDGGASRAVHGTLLPPMGKRGADAAGFQGRGQMEAA